MEALHNLPLAKDVPKVDSPINIICLLLNIVWPGTGSILCGIIGGMHMTTIIVGILQFVLSCILIGWIWSIIWGLIIFTKP